MKSLVRALPFVLFAACAHLPGQSAQYQVANKYKIGGEGGWDYLVADPEMNRLFMSRGTHVMVMNSQTGAALGDIPNTLGVHGIALAPALNRGFTSNGRDSTVTVFDYKTLQVLDRIHINGRNPDAIIYEPVTRRIFTFNGGSADATAIDAATGKELGNIPLGGKPEAANFDLMGNVFVNIEDKSEVVSFNAATLKLNSHWAVANCEDPTGQGIDRTNKVLFLACGNKQMAVVSYADGHLVSSVPIGEGTDGAAFDPATRLAFSTNGGDGTVTVIHQDSPTVYSVVQTVPSQAGARTIALDERTHRVYTVSADFGTPPAPTPERPRPRAPMIPGTFTVIVLSQ